MHTPISQTNADDKQEDATVTRTVEIDAPIEEVWEAVATETGRDRWLECDPERELTVESEEPPSRIVWWWSGDDGPATRVEIRIAEVPAGVRVAVTETAPASFPLAQMAASFDRVLAFA